MVVPFFSLGWNPDDLLLVYHKGNCKVYFRLRIEAIVLIALSGLYFETWLVALYTSLISQHYFICNLSEESRSKWCYHMLILYFSCFSGLTNIFLQWRSDQKSFVNVFFQVFLWVKTLLIHLTRTRLFVWFVQK